MFSQGEPAASSCPLLDQHPLIHRLMKAVGVLIGFRQAAKPGCIHLIGNRSLALGHLPYPVTLKAREMGHVSTMVAPAWECVDLQILSGC